VHEGSRKAIVAAFLANLGIAIAKFVAFAITGAASLLAEAIHSVADTGNQGLLFLGGHRARKPATRLHPFGYGRERYFWAFVVSLVLFSLGSVFALVEGVEKLIHPHAIEDPIVAYVVLGVAIALEAFSFRTAIREAQKVRHRHSWWQFIRSAKSPELPVVLLEDLGALVGLMFALVGISLSEATGEAAFDALGSIAIGLLLGVIAVVLAIEMKSLLIGESAAPAEEQAIVDTIEADPQVERLIHLRTQHLGPDELLVAAKVELAASTTSRLGAAIDDLEGRIRGVVPTARVIYIEPDEYRPGGTDEVRDDSNGDHDGG
jgi:cation diffusion facilitator family transporter